MEPIESEERVQTVCLLILTGLAITAALHYLQVVLIPFVLALFLTISLTPLVDLQVRRLQLPRQLAVAATLVTGVIVLGLLGVLISVSIRQLMANADTYQTQAVRTIQQFIDALGLDKLGVSIDENNPLVGVPADAIRTVVLGTTNAVVNLLSQGVLVLLFMCFLLFGAKGQPARGLWREVEVQTRQYVLTKALLSVATGVLTGAILWLLGIPLAMVFGLLAFLLNFIPSVGSILATLLPLPMVLVDPEATVTTFILVLALPGTVQFVIGNVIEPRMMGKSFGLHAITVLLALIFWGMIWGIIGMLLAVPLTCVTKILLTKNPKTAPLADLLAGRMQSIDGRA